MSSNDVENDIRPQISDYLPCRKQVLTMDEAISKTKFGLFNYVIILVSGVTLCAVVVETTGIAYVLPVLCDMDLTSREKGLLAGSAFFGVICSSHLFGYLADTKGRRRIIQPTLFMAFFITVICSFVQNFYVFTILRFLSGFFMSGSAANIFAYLGEFHNNKQRSHAIISITVIYNGLCALIPITAWIVTNQSWLEFQIPLIDLTYKPWRLLIVLCSVPGLLSALALIFLPESPKFVLSQGNKTEAYRILQKMNRWNNGKDSELEEFEILEEVESNENKQCISGESRFPFLESVWNQTVPLFKRPYLRSTILLCTMQFGIYSVFNGFFMFFAEIINRISINLDSFIDDRMMMCDAININTVNTSGIESNEICIEQLDISVLEQALCFEVAITVGLAIAGLILRKVGKFPVIFFILLSTGLSGIGCMLINIPFLQISLFVWLLCSGIVTNILSSAAVDLYPTTLRAMAVSIALMFGRLGAVIGANTVALLLDDNCESAFYLSGSILIAMGILAFFIPNIHKRTTNSDEDQTKADPRPSIISFGGTVKSF